MRSRVANLSKKESEHAENIELAVWGSPLMFFALELAGPIYVGYRPIAYMAVLGNHVSEGERPFP